MTKIPPHLKCFATLPCEILIVSVWILKVVKQCILEIYTDQLAGNLLLCALVTKFKKKLVNSKLLWSYVQPCTLKHQVTSGVAKTAAVTCICTPLLAKYVIHGGPKKLDHFWELINLRGLMVKRCVICQKFVQISSRIQYKTCMSVCLNILR